MATRGNIIVQIGPSAFLEIYTHWNGSPDGNGQILQDHYASDEKAARLIKPGDISSLGPKCDKPRGHTFDNRAPDRTTYYGRDRGETGCEPRTFDTLEDALLNAEQGHTYVRTDGRWWYTPGESNPGSLRPLTDVLGEMPE